MKGRGGMDWIGWPIRYNRHAMSFPQLLLARVARRVVDGQANVVPYGVGEERFKGLDKERRIW